MAAKKSTTKKAAPKKAPRTKKAPQETVGESKAPAKKASKKEEVGKSIPTKKPITAKETIYKLWKKAPAQAREKVTELAAKYGVKESSVKSWMSAWGRGQNLPAYAKKES